MNERVSGLDATLAASREVAFSVNGESRRVTAPPVSRLADVLRDELGLTGTKIGCNAGDCGACTVRLDGRQVCACLVALGQVEGRTVTTVEGLSASGTLHPLQQAFLDHDAFQCGYCTPGQLCSAVGMLQEGHAKTPDEIRELMSGNICRCGAYQNIVAAIQQAMTATGGKP